MVKKHVVKMIPHQKRFSIILFVLSLVLLFFSILPNTYAAKINSFSINDEGKYFIYYGGNISLDKVEIFRNKVIEVMPLVEKWGGIDFHNVKMAIVPDSFNEYQAIYEGTEIWNSFGLKIKDIYRTGIARPQVKTFIVTQWISETFVWDTAEHELCHLVSYPFTFDRQFSEGEASKCRDFVAKALGEPFGSQKYGEAFSKLSPEEKKIYGVSLNLKNSHVYPVGFVFIEKILDEAGEQDLSAFHKNLRNDFSEVVEKYQEYNLALIKKDPNGKEVVDLDLIYVGFYDTKGQEVIQCELIKTYGEKIAPVFTEFGFPDAVNCDSKIEDFKNKKIKELNDWLRLLETGDARETHEVIKSTESDPWIGKVLDFSQEARTTDRVFRPIFGRIPNKTPGVEVSSRGYPMLSFLSKSYIALYQKYGRTMYFGNVDTGTEAFFEGVGVHQGEKVEFPFIPVETFTIDQGLGYTGFTGRIEGLEDILVFSSVDLFVGKTGYEFLIPKMEVKKDATVGLKNATLVIEQNGEVVGTIPFIVDIEPVSEDAAGEQPVNENADILQVSNVPSAGKPSWVWILIVLVAVALGGAYYFLKMRKKQKI